MSALFVATSHKWLSWIGSKCAAEFESGNLTSFPRGHFPLIQIKSGLAFLEIYSALNWGFPSVWSRADFNLGSRTWSICSGLVWTDVKVCVSMLCDGVSCGEAYVSEAGEWVQTPECTPPPPPEFQLMVSRTMNWLYCAHFAYFCWNEWCFRLRLYAVRLNWAGDNLGEWYFCWQCKQMYCTWRNIGFFIYFHMIA